MNQNFVLIENKYLLGKTNQESDDFNVLLFAVHDVSEVSILPNIKIISESALSKYTNLIKVEIHNNSKLQSIEESAFSSTNIKQIYPKMFRLLVNKQFHHAIIFKLLSFRKTQNYSQLIFVISAIVQS